nr:AraC family transcriptional regulator [Novosphingobium hassiacum]
MCSNDAEVVHNALSRQLSRHSFDCSPGIRLDARVYSAEIGSIQIVDLQYGADVGVSAELGDDHILVHLALDGETTMWANHGKIILRRDEMIVSSPGTPLRVEMTPQCRHLAVRLPVATCTEYLSRELHIPVSHPLEFYSGNHAARELPLVWREMIHHISAQLRLGPSIMASRRLKRQYEMVLAEVLLGNYTNSYSEQIALHGNDISPRHVRRAREIIHQSLDDTISINALATQVGVSVRSLQNGFRDFLGLTPLEYVRRHRLERLHAALMVGSGDTSVTELMLECGIVNFGRYAQYYRQQYGCLPSETLRRRV